MKCIGKLYTLIVKPQPSLCKFGFNYNRFSNPMTCYGYQAESHQQFIQIPLLVFLIYFYINIHIRTRTPTNTNV